MNARAHRRSPLALVVLALLAERPMHPYAMQQLIKQRGKETVVNIAQRNSLYQMIDRLTRLGLVNATSTTNEGNRPARTTYAITNEGTVQLNEWLRAALSEPENEYPILPAALSFMMLLDTSTVAQMLRVRLCALEEQVAASEQGREGALQQEIPRLFLVEEEYREAVLCAEISWLRKLVDDIETGQLTWDPDWLADIAERFDPHE